MVPVQSNSESTMSGAKKPFNRTVSKPRRSAYGRPSRRVRAGDRTSARSARSAPIDLEVRGARSAQ
jgi:hypothetical protein